MTEEITTQIDERDQIAQRKAKLAELRKCGVAFPNHFRRDVLAADVHAKYDDKSTEELESEHNQVIVAGRIMLRRVMGKASFIHIQDSSGRIQIYLKQDLLPEGVYEKFSHWDLGDIVGVKGTVFKTKTGELSIKATEIQLLTKSLRPLPDKFHGLTDQELRYRQRYVDLIMNEETRKVFQTRTKIINSIRQFLDARGFLEVETPMMQAIPGGATARPFITHHNALDMQLYLRVATELYLKRLIVGGIEKVYEMNRDFRNEGLSTRHNPEFTMIEFYQAYATYLDLIDLTEELMRYLAQQVLGTLQVTYQGEVYDLAKPFRRMTIAESVVHYNSQLTKETVTDITVLRSFAKSLGIQFSEYDGVGKLQFEIFDKTVEHQLKEPTFITEYPTEVSPLARRNDHNPEIVDRFEFYIGGRELANAFSELNDPEDQAERFLHQVRNKDAGDHEAMHYDADYITALEYGMPPTAGEGIGIDRLTMFFTDSPTIRDVILFPLLRPL
jgi:lysyl-tRNA synthetase, class II